MTLTRLRHRRRAVAAALTGVICSTLAACGNSEAPTASGANSFDPAVFPRSTFSELSGTLAWYDSSGGLTTEAKNNTVWQNFTSLTGVPVQAEYNNGQTTKLRAAEQNGNVPWSLVEFGTGGDFFQAENDGLLQKLDTTKVPVDKLPPSAVTPHGIRVEENGAVLVWNKNALGGKTPTSTMDIFDTANYPGKRCLYKHPKSAGTLEVALRADGVPPDKIYPLDVPRAFNKLATIKDRTVWWNSGSTVIQLLTNGECSMGLVWSGRVFDAIENQKLPLDFTWKGGVTTAAYWGIPKNAPNPELGNAAIAMWILDRKGQIGFVNQTTYTTPIIGLGPESYSPQVRRYLAAGSNVEDTVTEDSQYYAKHLPELSAALASFQAR
ncbi:extracellular solute-binding protein [Saccharopolyspora hattusasensis]|uniref:extracellular solute-binding protein n=1 Tax=Saccharopolyspora hattusasensis TaxID=1128679 RepID=UPI003D96577A